MPKEVLKKYWNYDSFRPMQEEIITSFIAGNDVLAILPTGAGKSMCFQVPAMMKDGVSIVVSPLVSLMQDQVEKLRAKGINAVAVHSGLSKREIDITLDNCVYGNVKLLYLSPERLKTDIFQERVTKMKANALIIDESHCISQWGYDFRPSYLDISEIRKLIPDVPCMALTASATSEVQNDIVVKLELRNPEIFTSTFARPNISYSAFRTDKKENKILNVLSKVQGTAIVYSSTRKKTKEITQLLLNNGISADYYHAGLTQVVRKDRQSKWMKGASRVIVATNAFGMGIDKPEVRVVIHYDLPTSLEAYYQEAGRAGRDGKKSYAVLLFDQSDIDRLKVQMSLSYPSVEDLQKTYQALANYYKLAIGAGYMQSFDFIISEFAQVYDLDIVKTYHVIKVLQRTGVLQLSEEFANPSKLHMRLENHDMYKFQVANPQYDGVIKTILRTYGGEIYSEYLKISEEQLAKALNTDVAKLEAALVHLSKLGVLSYTKRNDKPQITFLQPRCDAKQLPVDREYLSKRKSVEQERVKEVIDYAENKKLCRMAILSLYFGEDLDDCGKCDNCLQKKKEILEELSGVILTLLKAEHGNIDFLVKRLSDYRKEDVIEEIRRLMEEGRVVKDEEGSFYII